MVGRAEGCGSADGGGHLVDACLVAHRDVEIEFGATELTDRELALELERVRRATRELVLEAERERVEEFRRRARKELEIEIERERASP